MLNNDDVWSKLFRSFVVLQKVKCDRVILICYDGEGVFQTCKNVLITVSAARRYRN